MLERCRSAIAAVVARRRDVVRHNLRTLMRHGARIAVGSDRFGLTANVEVQVLRQLQLWDERALLQLWSETTARSMFPRRRIGRLAGGYEASFLVLGANPLGDTTAVASITTRVKQGCLVTLGPPPVPR